MRTTDFAKHLTAFFTEYLIGERGVSPNTIRSYSESFSLLLNFLDEQANIKADNLRLEHITRKTVLNFLDWLQDTKKSSNATRNQRLAALRSLVRICSCDFPSYLSFPHGLLEMKRGYSSCPVIFYIQKVNAQS